MAGRYRLAMISRLKGGGGVEDEAVPLQFHRSGVVKPGVDGGVGELFFQSVKYCFPYVGQ